MKEVRSFEVLHPKRFVRIEKLFQDQQCCDLAVIDSIESPRTQLKQHSVVQDFVEWRARVDKDVLD